MMSTNINRPFITFNTDKEDEWLNKARYDIMDIILESKGNCNDKVLHELCDDLVYLINKNYFPKWANQKIDRTVVLTYLIMHNVYVIKAYNEGRIADIIQNMVQFDIMLKKTK